MGQAVRIYSNEYVSDSFGCAASFGQLLSIPHADSLVVTTVDIDTVQVLYPMPQFDYLLLEGPTFFLCTNLDTYDCQIRLLDASAGGFVALVTSSTSSVPVSLVGYTSRGNPLGPDGFPQWSSLDPYLAPVNRLISASSCLIATAATENWLSLQISEPGYAVVSYGACVFVFAIVPDPTFSAFAINPARYGITDPLFGRSSSISLDGNWVAISGTSSVYVFQYFTDSLVYIDQYPAYDQWGTR